jgi:hypothetical protein
MDAYLVVHPFARIIVTIPIFIFTYFFELAAVLYLGFCAHAAFQRLAFAGYSGPIGRCCVKPAFCTPCSQFRME